MADNKIEILTSNAKQVINDYVLGTDTDFQKVENAIQELAENDISTLNWNSLENYPDRSHDYQFSYNNSDGTIIRIVIMWMQAGNPEIACNSFKANLEM